MSTTPPRAARAAVSSRTTDIEVKSVNEPMKKLSRTDFVVPALLIALGVIPMLGGAMRLGSLSAPISEENARFVASPAPVLLHIAGASLYSLLGAFQFSKGIQRRFPVWHRRMGKVLGAAGLVVGLTGMWMAQLYAIPAGLQGPLLHGVRLLAGGGMIASLLLGWRAVLRRDVPRHEAWMIRAYALAQGAGTQAIVLGPWMLATGQSTGPTRDLLMTLSWAINLAVAERLIRRRRAAPPREPLPGVSPSPSAG